MIYINDKAHPLKEPQTLNSLLNDLQTNSKRGIAVAVNNTIIPYTEWGTYTIQDNDEILIIKATQGG